MRLVLAFSLFCLITVGVSGCELVEEYFPDCSTPITGLPDSYPKGTELYYLSWVEHGTFGPKGASANRLLEMENKSELKIAEKIYRCQVRQVIHNMMTLVLFDMAPQKYMGKAKSLLTETDDVMKSDAKGSWVKAGEDFEGEEVDFYFWWGAEAAVRLLKHGSYNKQGVEMTLARAGSLYEYDRKTALNTLSLFDGLPGVDLSNPPKAADKYPYEQKDDPHWNQQIETLKNWFETNEKRISWDVAAQRYRLRAS